MAKGGGQTPAGDYLMTQLPKNVTRATGIANQPFTPYTGQLGASVPDAVGQAQSGAQGVMGYQPQNVTAPQMQAASSGIFGLPQQQGITPGAPAPAGAQMARPRPGDYADRGQFRDARSAFLDQRRSGGAPGGTGGQQPAVAAMQGLQGLSAYTNPFQQQVTDRTLAGLDQFRQMALNQNASGAAMSGAFSNDRLGVQNALTNEGFARTAADTLANMNMQGFNTGAGLLMGDKSNLLQNQQFNAGLQQQAGLANQQTGLTAGIANQGAANDAARVNLGGAQTLGQLGGLQFGMDQQGLEAAYQEFMRQQNYPAQTQALINASLGLVGPSMAGQYNEPQRVGSNIAGVLGGAAQGAGMGLMMPGGYFGPAAAP